MSKSVFTGDTGRLGWSRQAGQKQGLKTISEKTVSHLWRYTLKESLRRLAGDSGHSSEECFSHRSLGG